MLQLKTLIRIMLSEKRQHIINITGLTIGLTVFLLISLYLKTELSFDKHISGYENKFRLLKKNGNNSVAIFPYSAAKAFQTKLPDLESICIVDREYGQFTVDKKNVKFQGVWVSDSSFISMFDINIIKGNRLNLLNEPNTCIVSESTAKMLFGNISPIGKTIKHVYNGTLTVKAVYKDLPATSHLVVNMVEARSTWRSLDWKKRYFSSWGNQGTNIYVHLNNRTSTVKLQDKLTQTIFKESPWFGDKISDEILSSFKITLQPLKDIHLKSSNIEWDTGIVKNSLTTLKAFVIVMVLVILMASFNYINLSTASSENKGKVSGLLKSLGSSRKQIFFFFFIQTTIIGLIATGISYLLTWLCLPYFQNILGVTLQYNMLFERSFLLQIILFIATVITVSGLYPAIVFSKADPIESLRNLKSANKSSNYISLRSALVTLQFVMSIFLIVTLFGIRAQMKLVTSSELGFNKEQLFEIQYYKDKKAFDYFSQELEKLASVKHVTAASNMPCEYINNENTLQLVDENNKNNPSGCIIGVEPNYFETMGTELLQGRWFNKDYISDSQSVLVNQATVRALNLVEPLGKRVRLMGQNYTIVGVVKDTQYRTLHEAAKPILYATNYDNYRKIAIRLQAGNHIDVINQIKEIWHKTYPNNYIDIRFFDDKLQSNYQTEINQLLLFNILVVIGIIVLVLGLIGIIWFITEKRIKEIGVRKVNGAKVIEILALLNSDLLKWCMVAILIAVPISHYSMQKWLENFAYKTELSWWIFALAGVVALGIALLTVSWQSWKAATRNPVEALRYE